MFTAPDAYLTRRATLEFDEIEYGVGGIQLLKSTGLEAGQVGYSVAADGKSLASIVPGDWQPAWVVIGRETACGDPIFLANEPPFAVFTAMHGEGSWNPQLVAPTLDIFWACLELFRKVASGRSNPAELEANPLKDEETLAYLQKLDQLCDGNEEAIGFWTVLAEIGMDGTDWNKEVSV